MEVKVSESLRSVARVVLLAHVLISVLCRQAFARYKRMLEQNDNKGLAVCTAASSFTRRCFTRAQDTSAACDEALSVLDATPSPSCKVGRTCAQSHPASCPPPPPPLRVCTRSSLFVAEIQGRWTYMRSAIDRCCFAARFIHPLVLCAELPLLTPL